MTFFLVPENIFSVNSYARICIVKFFNFASMLQKITMFWDIVSNASFIEQRVAAPWVLSVLASLHWRIIGKPRNALDCLQQALSSVPAKFRDVPLVSIASISQKLGFIDEALRTAKEALRINSIEVTYDFYFPVKINSILLGNYQDTSSNFWETKMYLRDWPNL